MILLVHNILKTEVTSASFISGGKVPSVILSMIILVITGRHEWQICLRVLASKTPWLVAYIYAYIYVV